MSFQKICEKCGEKISSNDIYCAYCGANLKLQKEEWKPKNITEISSDLHLNESLIQNYHSISTQLEDLDKVNLSYTEHKKYVDKLNQQVQQANQLYQSYQFETKKELKDVEDLKNLTFTSIISRLKGDKEERLKKEEMEYITALNREQAAKKDLDNLNARIDVAQKELAQLSQLKDQKEVLEAQLVKIVDIACEGVPDPIEDKIEQEFSALQQQRIPLAHERNNLRNALSHLQNAQTHFQRALNSLQGAKGASDWDTFFGGGFFADSIKHSRVAEARDAAIQAQRSLQRTYEVLPSLPRIRAAQVEDMNFFWDTFMDNIFSDLNARDKIMRSRNSVEQSLYGVNNAIQTVKTRMGNLENNYHALDAQIKRKRQELTQERKRMIEEAIRR